MTRKCQKKKLILLFFNVWRLKFNKTIRKHPQAAAHATSQQGKIGHEWTHKQKRFFHRWTQMNANKNFLKWKMFRRVGTLFCPRGTVRQYVGKKACPPYETVNDTKETLFVIRRSLFVKSKNIKKPMAMQLLLFVIFYE